MTSIRDAVVRRTIVVPVSTERAFDFFANRMIEWWPREFTFSEGAIVEIGMELFTGGRWYERDSNGNETTWGTVREWDSDARIVLTWRISPQRTPELDDARASEIEVVVARHAESSTRLELEHRCFERHGDGADGMLTGMDSPEGWTKILDRFASLVVDESEHKF